ncbi:UNVERIFIED_CONTAM: hypothetical protein Sindi_2677500, partial [Sesamum indicum]
MDKPCFCDQDDNLDLELRLGQPGAASASQHEDPLVYKRGRRGIMGTADDDGEASKRGDAAGVVDEQRWI